MFDFYRIYLHSSAENEYLINNKNSPEYFVNVTLVVKGFLQVFIRFILQLPLWSILHADPVKICDVLGQHRRSSTDSLLDPETTLESRFYFL